MSHVLVICAKRYNGHELWTLLGVLKGREHTFEVVSQDTTIRDELTLRPNTIERTVYTVDNTFEFDAVAVVSGNMDDTEAYWTDKHVERLLQAFKASDRVCAAICCSVPTLGPIAKDVKVSYFPLIRARHRLRDFGAILQNTSLTVDETHKVITAENQMVTEMWAEEICNMLEDKPVENVMVDSGFVPKGHERMMMPEVRAAIDEARGAPMIIKKKVKAKRKRKKRGSKAGT